jgi:hypothetical protein
MMPAQSMQGNQIQSKYKNLICNPAEAASPGGQHRLAPGASEGRLVDGSALQHLHLVRGFLEQGNVNR